MHNKTLILVGSTENKPDIANAWDAHTGTTLMTFKGENAPSHNGLAVAGGCMMACVKGKAQMFAYALNDQSHLNKRLVGVGGINAIALSPTGGYLCLAVREILYVYHVNSGQIMGYGSAHFQNINIIKYSGDGVLIACGGEDGLITLWNSVDMNQGESTQPRHTISSHSVSIIGIQFSGPKLISCSADKTIGIFDLNSGTQSMTIGMDRIPSCFTVAQDNIFLGGLDGSITNIGFSSIIGLPEAHIDEDTRTNFTLHEAAVTDLTHSPDQTLLISGSADCTIKIWHILFQSLVRTIKTKSPVTNIICFYGLKSSFTPGVKPALAVQDFNNKEVALNLSHRTNLSDRHFSFADDVDANASSTMVQNLKNELNKMKAVNQELYKHCMKKNLESLKKVNTINLNLSLD